MLVGATLTLLGVAGVLLLYERDQRHLRRTRAAFFKACLDLFESCQVTQDALAYPVLIGTFRGARVRLEPVVDHLAWRKLPCLWLKVSVFVPLTVRGVVSILARQRGDEGFSPSADLHHRVALPVGWPHDMAIRTDDPAGMPPLATLEPHVRLFANPEMKEMVLTARGVRLVTLAAQAQRGKYTTLRQIDFGDACLRRAAAAVLLQAALTLAEDLAAPPPAARVAA